MARRTSGLLVVSCVVAAVLAGGCTWPSADQWTPRGRLAAARETFNGTVNALAALREGGQFTQDESEGITLYIETGHMCLARWEAAIDLGQGTAGPIEQFNAVIRELMAAQKVAERRAANRMPQAPAAEDPAIPKKET